MSTIAPPSMALPVAMPFLDQSDYSGLMPTGRGPHGPAAAQGGRAHDAARSPAAVGKGFEEIFTSILLKHMRQTLGEDGLFGHDPGDVLGGMFDHFMSAHIAQNGGLGIGKVIQKHLEHRSAKT